MLQTTDCIDKQQRYRAPNCIVACVNLLRLHIRIAKVCISHTLHILQSATMTACMMGICVLSRKLNRKLPFVLYSLIDLVVG